MRIWTVYAYSSVCNKSKNWTNQMSTSLCTSLCMSLCMSSTWILPHTQNIDRRKRWRNHSLKCNPNRYDTKFS